MQAHHQQSQRPMTPSQIRPPHQQMNASMVPPGMHMSGQMGPQPNMNGQPGGPMQQGMPPQGQQPPPQRQQMPPPQQQQHLPQQAPPPPHGGPQGPMPPHQQPPPQQPQPQGPPQQQQPQPQQQPPPPPPAQQQQQQPLTATQRLSAINEKSWLQMGNLAEYLNDTDRAMASYENALRHNPYSQTALTQIANIYRSNEDFAKAVEYFHRIVNLDGSNGEIWGAIGNCYLMLDELPKAYQAYQQAIYHLPDPKEPKLWYGIGILYDRYGSYDHAEEAFGAVMRMDPHFDKATEIYFRLGIIHKCQGRYEQSLQCFNFILKDPPKPLTEIDIWFQIGNVYELQKDYAHARDAYERVLQENPEHGRVLQQLGALFFQPNTNLTNVDAAIQLLSRAIEIDKDKVEAHTWYLLGRCYMAQRLYNKAYEAYQQAVYRDGNNATYWCSIGVLYYQINQYRDALDAYSRAIRINPYLSEVWFDLGALYEACNNQVNDAIDAYTRAAELDRTNSIIEQRLDVLRRMQAGQPVPTGASQGPAPIDPPTGPTTAGQPNAPGGPAGESGPHGSVPGSLGAPPMAGPAGSGVPQPPEQHMRHPSEPQRGGPPPPGMQQQHPGQGSMQPMHQQQPQQQQQKMPPQHQQGGAPMPSGRPGYIDEGPGSATPYGNRYDGPPRSEVATSGGAPIPSPHYSMQQGSQAGAGPYQPAAAPYTSAPYSQPPTSRPYSASSQPPSAGVYGPQPQQQGGPYRPGDERRGSSRTGSPMVTQQQQQQYQRQQPPQQVTSSTEPTPTSGTFHSGPVNGYAPYPGQPALSDTRRHSRSPSQPHSAGYRQQHRQADEKPSIYGNRFPENTSMPPPTSLPPFSQDVPRSELRTPVGTTDRSGDAQLTDAPVHKPASPKKVSPPKSPLSADAPAPQSSSEIASASMSAAPISLPQVAMPTPTSASTSSDGHGNALSGPTAAPIRLPPVQFGGSGNFSSPSNRSPLNSVSSASQQPATDDASKGGSGPLSLASAMSADDDHEGSAINSLMSLSNVATTMTSRPQSTPAQQGSVSPRPQDAVSVGPSASAMEHPVDTADSKAREGLAITTVIPAAESNANGTGPAPAPGEDAVPSGAAAPSAEINGRRSISSAHTASPPPSAKAATAAVGDLQHDPVSVVPAKRPLSPGAEQVSGADASASKSNSDDGADSNGASAAGQTAGMDDGVPKGSADASGPRKRGRASMSPAADDAARPLSSDAAPSQGVGSNANSKTPTVGSAPVAAAQVPQRDVEMEEGEEPEDGEVFEDDEIAPASNEKPRKSEDVVMGSGKIKHD